MKSKTVTLTIDGETKDYVQADTICNQNPTSKQILILQRGWIVIADVAEDGDNLVMTNGSHIRRWGTTKGIGQLATEGKQEDTRLDYFGDSQVHKLSVVQRINVVSDNW